MLRKLYRDTLWHSLRQVAKLPLSRRAIHRISVATRGPGVVFLRCRRLLPDSLEGRAHLDRTMGAAMLPSEFEAVMKASQKTLRFVHPGEAISALTSGERLKDGAAVLTFDESFALTAELALPIMRRLGIPALFFVTTDPLESGRTLWDQAIHNLVSDVAPRTISVPFVDELLKTEHAKDRAQSLKRLLLPLVMLDERRLHRRLVELYQRVGHAPPRASLDRMLTTKDVVRISSDPLVSIGAHGHNHLALSALSDDTLAFELETPRKILRELCGSAFANVVSYPFGRPPYVDERVTKAARLIGYDAGFGALPGVARPGDHLFMLPRSGIDPKSRVVDAYELQGLSDAIDEFVLVATGTSDRQLSELEG